MVEERAETKELVERAKNLDGDAFGRLYDMYYENIYKYAYFKTGNPADAEDLTAQVFFGALRTIKNFSWRDSTFASWLFRIAHNVVVDHWRRKGRATNEPIGDHHLLIADKGDVTQTVIAKLQYDKVQSALAQLPEDQARVLVLRFINGLSVRETAAVMGKTAGAVKAQQFRAVAALREMMGGEIDE